MDSGEWKHFACIAFAAQWLGGSRENVGRCCRDNRARHVNKKNGAINTDHKYMGVRFYFENDNIWTKKNKLVKMDITCIDCQKFGECDKDPCADDGVCNDFTPEAWAEEENENDPAIRETK